MPLPVLPLATPPPDPTVLRSRCRLAGALWCHATLTATRLELRTWTVRGSADRAISLDAIREATWRSQDARGALLHLDLGDERVELQLRGAALWKLAIDERVRRMAPPSRPARPARRTYTHRALYSAPAFGTELAERPVAPLVPVGGDGYDLPAVTPMR